MGDFLRTSVLILAVLVTAASSSSDSEKACDGDAVAKRRAWIETESTELSGYKPSFFRMSTSGSCDDTLRVREDDCTAAHLVNAYGVKPFMRTVQSLGFRKISCGYDEYDLDVIVWLPKDEPSPPMKPKPTKDSAGSTAIDAVEKAKRKAVKRASKGPPPSSGSGEITLDEKPTPAANGSGSAEPFELQ